MPDIIRLLPESIANQIAAGEVVQRPSSVVKELLENSLDAGATKITLIFKDGGQTLIQVVDNGGGMTDTDARMCWERHATSKIQRAQDLFDLSTFGFRGEALASIASVSQVEMRTRSESDDLGSCIVIDAGEVKKQEPIQHNVGTSIQVKNLFFNIPVRRNFLKSISVETRYILEEFQRAALSRPEVEMVLMNGENEVYHLQETNLRQRIEDVMAKSRSGKLLAIDEQTDIVNISGFVGSPERAKKTRGDQYFYVNGRYIRDAYFHHAVAQSFEGLIEMDYHPMYVLFLEMDPSKIDVNVHPTKTEVKFQDGRYMYAIIKSVIQKALSGYHAAPVIETTPGMLNRESYVPQWETRTGQPTQPQQKQRYTPFDDPVRKERQQTQWEKLYEPFRDNPVTELPAPVQQVPLIPKEQVLIGKLFQLNGKYIVSEINGQLYVFHQQLAQERVLYEKYSRQLKQERAPSQQLLFPRTLELATADFQMLLSIKEELEKIGFDIAEFGKNTVIVNGTPADIKKGEEREMLEEILDSFKVNQSELKLEKRDNLARSLAKSASVKLGTVLNEESMQTLVQALFQCDHPGHTPSGRPVMVAFDPIQIEGFFKRKR